MADTANTLASNASHLSSFSSFSGSTPPTIFNCRWGWCRQSFFTNSDLVNHVVQEHVQNSTPVRKRDISLLRRVEGVMEESLDPADLPSISGMAHSETGNSSSAFLSDSALHHEPTWGSAIDESQKNREQANEDSIPSHSVSQAEQEAEPPHESHGHSIPDNSWTIPPPTVEQLPLRGHESGSPFPTFESLSSPSRFVRIPSIPLSPAFDSQISRNTIGGLPRGSDDLVTSNIVATDGYPSVVQRTDQPSVVVGDAAAEARGEASQYFQPSSNSESQHPSLASVTHDPGMVSPKGENIATSYAGPLLEESWFAIASNVSDESQKEKQIASQSPTAQTWTMDLKTQCPVPSQSPTQTQHADGLQTQNSTTPSPSTLPSQAPKQTWYQASPPYPFRKRSGPSVVNGNKTSRTRSRQT